MNHQRSCHCGTIQFEIDAPSEVEVENWNCSICTKTGYLHLILPVQKFKFLKGEDSLITYRFNSQIAKHTFCKICGVKPFYTPRSNPDGIDINVNCLDTRPEKIAVVKFDGQNWDQNAHNLVHKSKLT
jgi:hypothetical protein|tara:strand:- start:508 stop:891 length:384 start_codon:yes stop_codon:yes gene_type:complete